LDYFDPEEDTRRKREIVATHKRRNLYEFVECDVRDLRALGERLPRGIQIVAHAAGRSSPTPTDADPVAAAEVNFQGALNLLEFCRMRRIHQFVLASCGGVYGGASGFPWVEEALPRPINPFDCARLGAEQFGHCYSALYSLQFVALRLFNVYGPGDASHSPVPALCRALLEGRKLQIAGDPDARRDFTYVDDAVRALRIAMSYGATRWDVFNIGSGNAVSMRALVHELETITGRKGAVQITARHSGDLLDSWGSLDKAERVLGYTPKVGLRDGLRRYLEWFLKNES
jgi:nucleoside-diphosphate-sugar epimerase